MGRKVFVSYKFKDYDVEVMPDITQPTWPCDYVDYIKNNVLASDDIYKGENSDEDISNRKAVKNSLLHPCQRGFGLL